MYYHVRTDVRVYAMYSVHASIYPGLSDMFHKEQRWLDEPGATVHTYVNPTKYCTPCSLILLLHNDPLTFLDSDKSGFHFHLELGPGP